MMLARLVFLLAVGSTLSACVATDARHAATDRKFAEGEKTAKVSLLRVGLDAESNHSNGQPPPTSEALRSRRVSEMSNTSTRYASPVLINGKIFAGLIDQTNLNCGSVVALDVEESSEGWSTKLSNVFGKFCDQIHHVLRNDYVIKITEQSNPQSQEVTLEITSAADVGTIGQVTLDAKSGEILGAFHAAASGSSSSNADVQSELAVIQRDSGALAHRFRPIDPTSQDIVKNPDYIRSGWSKLIDAQNGRGDTGDIAKPSGKQKYIDVLSSYGVEGYEPSHRDGWLVPQASLQDALNETGSLTLVGKNVRSVTAIDTKTGREIFTFATHSDLAGGVVPMSTEKGGNFGIYGTEKEDEQILTPQSINSNAEALAILDAIRIGKRVRALADS